jgi:transposase InsO family protein
VLVHQLIAGLHPRYHTLKTMMPALPKFPTFMEARTMLIAEEASQNKAKTPASTDTALIASEGGSSSGEQTGGARPDGADRTNSGTGGGRGGGGRSNNGSGGRNGGRGRGRGRNGGRGNYNSNNGNNYNNNVRTPFQQGAYWPPFFPPWGAPWGTGWRAPWTGATGPGTPSRPQHQAYNAYSQPSTTSAPLSWDTSTLMQALHAASLPQQSNGEWFMDTGASTHMTGDQGNLPTYCPSPLHNQSHIIVGNGSSLPVHGTGTTTISSPNARFLLSNVLHTPHLIKNLVSVRKFTKDNACSVEFDPHGFSIKDLHSKKEIMRSSNGGDLYSLGPTTVAAPVALTASSPSPDVWHRRLGHLSHQSLARVLSDFSIPCTNKVTHNGVCDACQRGRHVRLPFSSSTSFTYFPFQLIHCDLWTSPLVSFTGYQYYLVLIDDYSHYAWTFPLRNKSDATATIQQFYAYVLNQFHMSIQCIQCDNGGEFVNNTLRSFLTDHGIVFRLSCPYTSSQNGKAERAIRTINDIIRTLLLQAHMPPKYWVEALNTATYLLNRRPSKTINFVTPYQILFNHAPNYSHLRIFGCLCYPNLLPQTPHKLAPRSCQCVFLGYSPEHKGYRCLDLQTRKIIISRHVTFDEHHFPFEQQQTTTTPSTPDPCNSALDLLPVPPPASSAPSSARDSQLPNHMPLPTSTGQPTGPFPTPTSPSANQHINPVVRSALPPAPTFVPRTQPPSPTHTTSSPQLYAPHKFCSASYANSC